MARVFLLAIYTFHLYLVPRTSQGTKTQSGPRVGCTVLGELLPLTGPVGSGPRVGCSQLGTCKEQCAAPAHASCMEAGGDRGWPAQEVLLHNTTWGRWCQMPRLRHPPDLRRSCPWGHRLRLHLHHAGVSRPFSVRLSGQAYPQPSQKAPVQRSQLLEQLLLGFPTSCCNLLLWRSLPRSGNNALQHQVPANQGPPLRSDAAAAMREQRASWHPLA